MAAGIGEASAILAVAQIGISLSNTLIAYISEVKDAPSRIERIGNEIHTTSERLKDIGELVDTNKQTHIISQEGIHSAVRCSRECCKIIDDVKEILCKAGWQQRPKEKDEIDTSLFSTLRCPSSEQSLRYPQRNCRESRLTSPSSSRLQWFLERKRDFGFLINDLCSLYYSTPAQRRPKNKVSCKTFQASRKLELGLLRWQRMLGKERKTECTIHLCRREFVIRSG